MEEKRLPQSFEELVEIAEMEYMMERLTEFVEGLGLSGKDKQKIHRNLNTLKTNLEKLCQKN